MLPGVSLDQIESEIAAANPDPSLLSVLPMVVSFLVIPEPDLAELDDNPLLYLANFDKTAEHDRAIALRIIKAVFSKVPNPDAIVDFLGFTLNSIGKEPVFLLFRHVAKYVGAEWALQQSFSALSQESDPRLQVTLLITISELLPKLQNNHSLTPDHLSFLCFGYANASLELVRAVAAWSIAEFCRLIDLCEPLLSLNLVEVATSHVFIHSGISYSIFSAITNFDIQGQLLSSQMDSIHLLILIEGFSSTWGDNIPAYLGPLLGLVLQTITQAIPGDDEERSEYANYFAVLCLLIQYAPLHDSLRILPEVLALVHTNGLVGINLELFAEAMVQFSDILAPELISSWCHFAVGFDEDAAVVFESML